MKGFQKIWRAISIFMLMMGPWLMSGQPVMAASQEVPVKTTLADWGYSDISLTGLFGAASVWIPFQSDWTFENDAQVGIDFIASDLLFTERSTLTVFVNDLEVASVRSDPSGGVQHFSFTIPVERLKGKGISIRFQAYLRLTDLVCEEANNPAQWMTILKTSTIDFAAGLNTDAPDLTQLPSAIIVQNTPGAEPSVPVVFVLPDNPTGSELTVAGQIASRLGTESGSSLIPFTAETTSTLTQTIRQAANLVVIGTPDRQPLIEQMAAKLPAPRVGGSFLSADGIAVPSEHGAIQIFNSPWNPARHVLLVSAGAESGLILAGQAFADQASYATLTGSYTFVRELAFQPNSVPGIPWMGEKTTFAQLGEQNRTVRGTGIFKEYYYFHRPPGWILDIGTQLTLHFAASSALSARESYISVFVNDIPVGTVRIGADLNESEAVFDLPITQLNQSVNGERPQNLTLRLEVANFLSEANCEQLHPESAWTRIQADSFFVTPHVYLSLPDLQAYPYPFVGDQPDGNTLIILPPQPNSAEMGAALSMAASLGKFSPLDFSLSLRPADQVDETNYQDANLIVLGSRDRQPLIDQFLNNMVAIPGFRGEAGLYRALISSTQGLLREGPSPWSSTRVVLLVFGETEEGFGNAAAAMFNVAPPVKQPGSVALVDENLTPEVVYRSIDVPPEVKPGQVNREPIIPKPQSWMVIAAVLVLASLAVLLVLLLARRRAGK